MSKPEMRYFRPEIREMLIERRNYWRAQRGQPIEIWDSTNERLVDRDDFILETVSKAITGELSKPVSKPKKKRATEAARGTAVTEVAPDHGTPVAENAPEPTATPAPPAKPYHEMEQNEFHDAARAAFASVFAEHDANRANPRSPFWHGMDGFFASNSEA